MANNNLPWGDAFIVSTPTIDRVGQQLYAEQKIRQTRQQQENAALDASIQKELGKVRSVDTPEVINSYNQYKQLRKQLLFDKNLQKDPLAYNQAQQAANQAYQSIFTTANKSAELKDMQKQLVTERMKSPDLYADDAGQRISTLMTTPVSGVSQHPDYGDLTNWDNYRYQGSNTDFGKLLKDAIGMPKQVYTASKDLDGGLQTQLTPYMYANTPAQVKESLLGSMGLHRTGRDAAYQWDQLTDREIDETIKAYNAISKEKWERMGLSAPQELLSKNPNNKAENYAGYQAMKYAIANDPKEGTPVFRTNLKASKDYDFNRQKAMEAIRHANAKDLIKYKKDIDPNDADMNNVWYQSYLDNVIKDAKSSGERHHVYTKGGKSIAYYNMVKPDPFLMKSFQRGKSEPDRLGITESGEIMPIFFKYDKEGKQMELNGNPIVDLDYSQPLSYEQALVNLGYRGRTKKQLGEDLGRGIPSARSGSRHPLPAGKPRTVTQGGYTYTWNEVTGQYE